MTSTHQSWRAIEGALEPRVRRTLRRGARRERIEELEHAVGRIPASLRAHLSEHDGMRREPLYLNVRLLGVAEIVKTWRMRIQTSELVGYTWHAVWIPITDADGDHICVDRHSERVIGFTNAGARSRVIAPGLDAWLARVPRFIRDERRSDRRLHDAIPTLPPSMPKRERDRVAKLDQELPLFIAYLTDLGRASGSASRERALGYRPIARVKSAEVVKRASELGCIRVVAGEWKVTPFGKRMSR